MRRYVSSPILTMTYYLRAVLLHVLPPRSGRAAGRVGVRTVSSVEGTEYIPYTNSHSTHTRFSERNDSRQLKSRACPKLHLSGLGLRLGFSTALGALMTFLPRRHHQALACWLQHCFCALEVVTNPLRWTVTTSHDGTHDCYIVQLAAHESEALLGRGLHERRDDPFLILAHTNFVGPCRDALSQLVDRLLRGCWVGCAEARHGACDMHLQLIVEQIVEHAIGCCDQHVSFLDHCSDLIHLLTPAHGAEAVGTHLVRAVLYRVAGSESDTKAP